MPDFSNPAEYYERIVPQQFFAAAAEAPERFVDDQGLTATYIIEGEGGGTYGLRAYGKQIEFTPGGIEGSDLLTTMTIQAWRASTSDDAIDPLVDYLRRGKADVVKALKGRVSLDLTGADEGRSYESSTVFNNTPDPEVTLRMTTDDHAAMLRGDLNGQMAFMTGKLKFEGSLPLLMQVGNLSGT